MPKDCQTSWRLHVSATAVEQWDTSQHYIVNVSFLRHTLSHIWVSTSKMMSQFRCVWLGRLTKMCTAGGPSRTGWLSHCFGCLGEGQHAAVLLYAARGRWNIHKTQTRSAECSSSAALPVCISTGMYFEKYILQLLNCIYYY